MNQFPFRKDPNPDLTRTISEIVAPKPKAQKPAAKTPDLKGDKYGAKPVAESHTRAELEKLSTTRLRELMKKYERLVLKGDRDAARELADIRGILRSKGAGHALEEASACERAALARLKAANAEDLEEKGGAAGKAAHKRLHKTIGKVLGEARDTTEPLSEAIKNEDEFRTALAMTRIYDKASRLFDMWSRGGNWDMLGYMVAAPEDLTPAHKAELQKWATSFEKLADKLDAELNRYENPPRKTSAKKSKRK